MKLQELNPFIRYCNIHPQPILYPEPVRAYDCRIFYVLQGSGIFYVEDDAYAFDKDSFLYIPSGVKYYFSYEKDSDTRFLILNFDLGSTHIHSTSFLPVCEPDDFDENSILTVPDCPQFVQPVFMYSFSDIKKDLLTIYNLFVNKPYLYSEQASGLLKTILMQAISVRHTENKSSFAKITEEVLSFIRSHSSEPLTNEIIAEQFGFHSYYLNRVIKNETGQNMHHYLIHYRVQEAKSLLSTSSLTIQNIAALTGFGSPSQFSVAFKKVTGITPLQYREENNMRI